MATLEVTVATLKKRTAPVDDPANTTNVVGQVQKGFQFQSISQVNNSLGTWYQDQDNYYYWGGGLTIVPTAGSQESPGVAAPAGAAPVGVVADAAVIAPPAGGAPSPIMAPPPTPVNLPINTPPPPNNVYPQWMTDLSLPQIWAYATGQNVGVAVVDTGIISGNSDLPYSQKNFFTYASGVSLQDNVGHGTNCAGLIGAKNRTGTYIGVAPGCNLYICKIAEQEYFDLPSDASRYADAINWCAKQQNIHIISISWGNPIQDAQILSNIQNAINNALANKKVILCAIGDATNFIDSMALYPACSENTISVGSIPVQDQLYPFVNDSLLISTQGVNLTSYGIDTASANLVGTSQSNAILAGVVALIIQKLDFSFSYQQISGILRGLSTPTDYYIRSTSGAIVKGTLAILNGGLLLKYFKP